MCLKLIMRNRWSGKKFWQLLFFLQFSLVCSFPLTGKYCWRPYSLKDWAGENCKRKYFSFFREVVMGIKPLSQQEYVMQITKKKSATYCTVKYFLWLNSLLRKNTTEKHWIPRFTWLLCSPPSWTAYFSGQQQFLWDDCCGYVLNLQGLLYRDWRHSLLSLFAGRHGRGRIMK